MNITRISAITTLGAALVATSLSVAGIASAAGAGGHDRPRDYPVTEYHAQ